VNVSPCTVVIPVRTPVRYLMEQGHLPDGERCVRFGSNKYAEWQKLIYEGGYSRDLARHQRLADESYNVSLPPPVAKPPYTAPTKILARGKAFFVSSCRTSEGEEPALQPPRVVVSIVERVEGEKPVLQPPRVVVGAGACVEAKTLTLQPLRIEVSASGQCTEGRRVPPPTAAPPRGRPALMMKQIVEDACHVVDARVLVVHDHNSVCEAEGEAALTTKLQFVGDPGAHVPRVQ
jgi:hypothetical protein